MKKIVLLITLIVLISCKKSKNEKVEVIPLAPTELNAIIVSNDQIDLIWKDNANNEIGYKVERKTDSGNFTEIGSVIKDLTTFSDKSVSSKTSYTYRVYAYNQVGQSVQYSNDASVKIIVVPSLTTSVLTNIFDKGAKSGGTITSDGGSSIIARGVVWGTITNPTIALSTKTSDGTGTDSYPSSISSLAPDTKYYVRAYATNIVGTSYGNELSFTTPPMNTVISATGRIWMDRNLGASRVATSSTDADAYGDLYQWGRSADGHQLRTSNLTTTLAIGDVPGNADFIISPVFPNPWSVTPNDNLWQGVNGKNNPCPVGFRLPTSDEWQAERATWISNNSAGAFASPLKLPITGTRSGVNGVIHVVGLYFYYWSSTVEANTSRYLYLFLGDVGISSSGRAAGNPCRCIKD